MKGMAIKKMRYEGEEVEFYSGMYEIFEDLSSKPPKRIEGFRARMHKEIDAVESKAKDAKKMHAFIDLLVDACIKAAILRENSCIDSTTQTLSAVI